jgi:hypothetical protein
VVIDEVQHGLVLSDEDVEASQMALHRSETRRAAPCCTRWRTSRPREP